MTDVYDLLIERLSDEIPNEDTLVLLKELIEIYRSEGADKVTKHLKEKIKNLEGD
tara:strand:- start:1194 stop:1358 length:165 start_codon:yes stop_codon:yes gene_type:complete